MTEHEVPQEWFEELENFRQCTSELPEDEGEPLNIGQLGSLEEMLSPEELEEVRRQNPYFDRDRLHIPRRFF